MKRKLIATALISACLFNTNVAYADTNSIVAPTAAVERPLGVKFEGGFGNYMAQGLVDSFLNNGLAAIPGGIVIGLIENALKNLIGLGEEDGTTKILDKLAEMDVKLDKIQTDISKSINHILATNATLDTFYKAQTEENLRKTIENINADNEAVSTKYSKYKMQGLLSNYTANDLKDIYNYAKRNTTVGALRVIEASNYKEISHSNLLSRNLDPEHGVDTLFVSMATTYSKGNDSYGSVINLFNKRRDAYIDAVFQIPGNNQDVMSYVYYYNDMMLKQQADLYGSYQKLYNMQLIQLAYKYSVGADIRFDNLQLGNINGIGEDKFAQAVAILNDQYNTTFRDIKIEEFSLITNKDLTNYINTKLFNSSQPLLSDKSFGKDIIGKTTDAQLNQCIVSSLKFQAITNSTGIATLTAQCLSRRDVTTDTYVYPKIQIPYTYSGSQVENYIGGIYFDAKTQSLKQLDVTEDSERMLTSENVKELCGAHNDVKKLENGTKLSSTGFFEWKSGILFQKFDINSSDRTFMYPVQARWEDKADRLPPQDWVKFTPGYSGKIYASPYTVSYNNKGNGSQTTYTLANAGGSLFCVSTETAYNPHTTQHQQYWEYYSTTFGISCVSNTTCKREAWNELKFTDGSLVKFNGSLVKGKDGLQDLGTWKGSLERVNDDGTFFVTQYNRFDWSGAFKYGMGEWNIETIIKPAPVEKVSLNMQK